MGMQPFGPDPGGAMGGPEQERLRQEAEHERLIEETEEIHAEEDAESAPSGADRPAPQPANKAPWWKFWSS